MSKLDFLDELTREADSAKVPELRVLEATRSSVNPHFEKEVQRIAHMITTIARASKNSTQEIWQMLEQHLRQRGDKNMNESLLATFRNIAAQHDAAIGVTTASTIWLKPREE